MADESWLDVKTTLEVREILTELRAHLERVYGERLRQIYLYGSYARNAAGRGSDLDVLVVLDRIESHWQEILRTSEATARLSLDHDLSIAPIFTTEDRWRNPDSPLLRVIKDEGKAA